MNLKIKMQPNSDENLSLILADQGSSSLMHLTETSGVLIEEKAFASDAECVIQHFKIDLTGIAGLGQSTSTRIIFREDERKPFGKHAIAKLRKQIKFKPQSVDPRYRRSPGEPYEGYYTFWTEEWWEEDPDSESLQIVESVGHREFYMRGERLKTGELVSDILDDLEDNGGILNPQYYLDQLMMEESRLIGRYPYVACCRKLGYLVSAPIPAVDFFDEIDLEPVTHLMDQIEPLWRFCIDTQWEVVEYLLDWFLWAFGHPCQPEMPIYPHQSHVHDRLHLSAFRSLRYMLLHPGDYFGTLLESMSNEYRAIPPQMSMSEAVLLAEDLFQLGHRAGRSRLDFGQDYRDQLLLDPRVGTGRLLMAASQYTCRVAGLNPDDNLLAKAALVNLFLYAPHTLFLHDLVEVPQDDESRIDSQSRTLAIARHRGIDLELYLADTTPNLEINYSPIQQLQFRSSILQTSDSDWEDEMERLLEETPDEDDADIKTLLEDEMERLLEETPDEDDADIKTLLEDEMERLLEETPDEDDADIKTLLEDTDSEFQTISLLLKQSDEN